MSPIEALTAETNPRVVLFLTFHGFTVADIQRDAENRVARLTIEGETYPWTIFYITWIALMWAIWASALGTKPDPTGRLQLFEVALRNGHTHEEFDQWLALECKPVVGS